MAEERTYENENQQNLMRVVEYMAQDILMPKASQELMDALNLSRDKVFRTLWNLKDRGWAEEVANGWRLAPMFVQYSDRLRLAVADTLHRYLPGVSGDIPQKDKTDNE